MNKQHLAQMWDHLRQVNGISMRVIAALPADKLDSHPIPKMRTPKELVVHMYADMLKPIAEGVLSGQIIAEDGREKTITAEIKSRDELLKLARQCWNDADKAASSVTDAQLAAVVKTPWGVDFPGFVAFGVIHDEFLHHRGQLYTYLRALGVEPPMMWDFEHNEPAFQPKAATQA